MHIDLIAGARPNFMKIAPIIKQINKAQSNGDKIYYRLIHTGQHYDKNMSSDFFDQLKIPSPDINLKAGGGTQAEQIAKIMIRYENVLKKFKPNFCLVVGDVNSTAACSIAAKSNNIKVIHVEGGIRSFDRSMPEENNRIITDSITDYFFTTSRTANENLLNCGISKQKIFFVGNTMIDSLIDNKKNFTKPLFWNEKKLKKGDYFVVTLHRPSNVDSERVLKKILEAIVTNSKGLKIVFPAHPRTINKIKLMKYNAKNLHIVDPMNYFDFNYLVQNSKAVVTDSGGVTEETTYLNIPCMTLRENTERPETITNGTNILLGLDLLSIKKAFTKLFNGEWKKGSIPELWDGKTSKRIIDTLLKIDPN